MGRVVSCGSTSFPWLVFFFGALGKANAVVSAALSTPTSVRNVLVLTYYACSVFLLTYCVCGALVFSCYICGVLVLTIVYVVL